MPEETVRIGNRDYQVACQSGEERFLQNAARLLDAEATAVAGQVGRLPENRVLLMAGLMLADKSVGIEEQLRAKEGRIQELEREVARLRETPAVPPHVPGDLIETLAGLAAKAESLADAVEEKSERA